MADSVKYAATPAGTAKVGQTTSSGTYYVLSGNPDSANIIIFIHGIGSYHQCFDELASKLAIAQPGNYRMVQYDLIGRGDSSYHQSGKFGADEHVEQLSQLLDFLEINSRVHIIAHSMGGALAAIFTSRYPEKVKALTLLSPAGLMGGTVLAIGRSMPFLHSTLRSMFDNRAQQEKAWRADFYNKEGIFLERQEAMVTAMRSIYDQHPHTMFEALWQCVIQFPLYGIYSIVEAIAQQKHLSVKLIWGDRDAAVPIKPSLQRWLKILKPGKCHKEHDIIQNGGHSFFLEFPDETAQLVTSFLVKVDATTNTATTTDTTTDTDTDVATGTAAVAAAATVTTDTNEVADNAATPSDQV